MCQEQIAYVWNDSRHAQKCLRQEQITGVLNQTDVIGGLEI